MEKELQLEIPLLLPQVEDEKDQCVERLLERVKSQRGIVQAHVERKNGEGCFCLHYDPNFVSLQQVQRWAKEAGTEVSERYKHDSFRITDSVKRFLLYRKPRRSCCMCSPISPAATMPRDMASKRRCI